MVGWLCVGFSKIYGNSVMNVELTEKQIFWQKSNKQKKTSGEKAIKTTYIFVLRWKWNYILKLS